MKKLTTLALISLVSLLAFTACDDDKVPVPPEEGTSENAEAPEKTDEAKTDDKPTAEDTKQPTYENMAESYSELESAYESMDASPAGMARQMREWGRQMMYMHEHDGHMKGGHHMMGDDDMGMRGMHGGEESDEPGYGPKMPAHMSGFGEWHRQMSDFHHAEAKERRAAGDESIAKQHELMARRHAAMGEGLGAEDDREPVDITDKNLASAGESLYANACATCHADDGTGVTEAFPPLAGAEIVTGDVELLTRITLHGMEGPLRVKDQNYNGMMPSFASRFSNDELAAILTYIRSSWGNDASPVAPKAVAEVRQKTKDEPGAVSTIKEGLAPTVE